jgi:hypothetical protein
VKDRCKGIFGSIFRESDFKSDVSFSLGDISFDGHKDSQKFLNRYSLNDMKNILDKTGLYKHLDKLGFSGTITDIHCDNEHIHYLKVYDTKKDQSHLIIDLRLSEGRFIPNDSALSYDMFFIEWLQSQNPRTADFSAERPQLPGQKRPGLGCLKYLTAMMQLVSTDLTRDGFLDVPDHFHLAVIYSRNFKFFSPVEEGKMLAVLRDLDSSSLPDIAWGVITKSIIDKKTGEMFKYAPSEEIFPLSDRMKDYFSGSVYSKKVKETLKSAKYILDVTKMQSEKKRILSKTNPAEL